jgi:phosphopantothenoylcysteine decarboxylase
MSWKAFLLLLLLLMQVAPAMNTFMWDSPFTSEHLFKLRKIGVKVVPPVSKALACGDIGTGAMASPVDIAASVQVCLQ